MVLVSYTRRCYIVSEAIDKMHIDIMCANMYREAVYLARRGYFYRDLFMEHSKLPESLYNLALNDGCRGLTACASLAGSDFVSRSR